MIDASALRALLNYDPETGAFTWIKAPTPQTHRLVGRVAGCPMAPNDYKVIRVRGRLYLAHRLAWLWMTGEWPPHEIDHINLDRTDNRFANLRPATRHENFRNRGVQKRTKSGAKGVYWHTAGKRWEAKIYVSGRTLHLGLFDTIDAASAAYKTAAEEHFGKFARA